MSEKYFEGDGPREDDTRDNAPAWKAACDELVDEVDALKQQLAACEVQRDAALAVCKLLGTSMTTGYLDLARARVDAVKAVRMTPADAANVVSERDRLRAELERIRDHKPRGDEYAPFVNAFQRVQIIAANAIASPAPESVGREGI